MAHPGPWFQPNDIFGSGAEDWQGNDGDWLAQLASNASALSSVDKSPYEQGAVNDQVSLETPTIDPRMVSPYSSKSVQHV